MLLVRQNFAAEIVGAIENELGNVTVHANHVHGVANFVANLFARSVVGEVEAMRIPVNELKDESAFVAQKRKYSVLKKSDENCCEELNFVAEYLN